MSIIILLIVFYSFNSFFPTEIKFSDKQNSCWAKIVHQKVIGKKNKKTKSTMDPRVNLSMKTNETRFTVDPA